MDIDFVVQGKREHGFSLIELMVVVAIIGLLASIALPSYQESIRKTKRGDAKAVLMQNAQFLERFFTQTNSYLDGGANPTLPTPPADGAAKYYDFSLSGTNTATAYTLQASPKGEMAGDACGTLTLNQAGVKGVSGASKPVEQCW